MSRPVSLREEQWLAKPSWQVWGQLHGVPQMICYLGREKDHRQTSHGCRKDCRRGWAWAGRIVQGVGGVCARPVKSWSTVRDSADHTRGGDSWWSQDRGRLRAQASVLGNSCLSPDGNRASLVKRWHEEESSSHSNWIMSKGDQAPGHWKDYGFC